ncbi:MAG: TIM44-like domain-containing protein, partial [Proteobacteria bacterium]|nr:TIM44-like domain-containing protein [Pseudomonadota bacterium]
ETRPDGTCVACDTVLDDGRLQWRATQLEVLERRPVRRPELTLGGGDEHGVNLPTVRARDLEAKARALQARHPDLSFRAFSDYVAEVTVRLNRCWSSLEWDDARPFLTDRLYQSMRFWIDGYRQGGLRNRVEDVRVENVELARIQLDAWYEAITVRVFASMLDWTETTSGDVVGGSKRQRRRYSE